MSAWYFDSLFKIHLWSLIIYGDLVVLVQVLTRKKGLQGFFDLDEKAARLQ